MIKHTNGCIEDYWKRIQSGEIIAGQEIKQVLMMLLEDMESDEYVYDTREADRRMDFIEHCVRLTKSPYFNKPMVLLDFEKAFMSALYGFYMASDGTERFRQALLMLSRKGGKALALDTPIFTPAGLKKFGDIHTGDFVYDIDYNPTEVLCESDIYNNECYKVKFSNGDSIVANKDHLWQVRDLYSAEEQVLTTEQIYNSKHGYGVQDRDSLAIIQSVSITPNVPTKCIAVASEDHLFRVGFHNTLTHNSEFSSALLLTDFFVGGEGRDIVCASNDDSQSDILYQACDTMRLLIDPRSKDSWRNQKGLKSFINNNRIFKLSERQRNREGRNLDMAVIDECFTPETEVMTDSGWKRFDAVTQDDMVLQYDEGEYSFVKPLRIIERDYEGEVIGNYVGKNTHIWTTPNHNMVFEHKGVEIVRPAKDAVKWDYVYIEVGCVADKGCHLTDLEKLAICTQADGSLQYKRRRVHAWGNSRTSKGDLYIIKFAKERKIERFLEISKDFDVVEIKADYRNEKVRRGFTYVLPSGRNYKLLTDCFDLRDFDYTKANEFIDEVMNWDGSILCSGIKYYSSKIKSNRDFVGAVAHLAGYRVTYGVEVDNRKETYCDIYRVYMKKYTEPKKASWGHIQQRKERKQYSGKVYCVEVPSHKILVKSEKAAIVCGNCHEMTNGDIINAIRQSQSLKVNPKLIFITTEGFVQDGWLAKELIRVRKILRGEVKDDASVRYLPFLYTQDSEAEVWNGNRENRLWMKSNPSLGVVKRYDYLEQQIALAKASKEDRAFVLTKDFNIPQLTSEAWLMTEDYSYNYQPFNPEDFRGAVAIGGVDLAETTDLCSAKVILRRPNDVNKYILSMYWIPETKLDPKNDDSQVGAKYKEWQKDDMMRVDSGNYVNTTLVADWFYELWNKYRIRLYKCGYDVRFSQEFTDRMDDYGFDYEMVYQRPEVMSLPNKMVETDLKHQEIIGLNTVDRWCLSNCALKLDSKGFGLVVKIDPSRRIDGAVSLIIAYEIYRRHIDEIERTLK